MDTQLKPMSAAFTFLIYGSAAILLYLVTHFLIPFLTRTTGQESILFWFIAGGLGVFLPLIIAAFVILRSEGYGINAQTWILRMRFTKITRNDLLWSFGGLFSVGLLSGLVMKGMEMIVPAFDTTPLFMTFEPLSSGRYWLLAVWTPYWILNIMGEEILWRGVMLPRQEIAFGKYAWFVHGCGWTLFHAAFGWQLLVTLIPLLFIQSYVVQKTKNSWTGVILHGGLNGPAFIAIALGAI